uniref:PE-38 n=1 Tax=Phthorimaea operculella granulovirus TaxID=192584 RepID=A0A481SEI6_9BBAC|nr:PE-38 [Phthorimaea operculella granulovirus]QBH66249.1 PE-38 [Phthorimaea operculella granulovirus]QBH66379.1 PE-38 [Phthorimaea operculella granulovirus]QBH66509.1 PE-38 [Phthorimaea operculella granulovirus]
MERGECYVCFSVLHSGYFLTPESCDHPICIRCCTQLHGMSDEDGFKPPIACSFCKQRVNRWIITDKNVTLAVKMTVQHLDNTMAELMHTKHLVNLKKYSRDDTDETSVMSTLKRYDHYIVTMTNDLTDETKLMETKIKEMETHLKKIREIRKAQIVVQRQRRSELCEAIENCHNDFALLTSDTSKQLIIKGLSQKLNAVELQLIEKEKELQEQKKITRGIENTVRSMVDVFEPKRKRARTSTENEASTSDHASTSDQASTSNQTSSRATSNQTSSRATSTATSKQAAAEEATSNQEASSNQEVSQASSNQVSTTNQVSADQSSTDQVIEIDQEISEDMLNALNGMHEITPRSNQIVQIISNDILHALNALDELRELEDD